MSRKQIEFSRLPKKDCIKGRFCILGFLSVLHQQDAKEHMVGKVLKLEIQQRINHMKWSCRQKYLASKSKLN